MFTVSSFGLDTHRMVTATRAYHHAMLVATHAGRRQATATCRAHAGLACQQSNNNTTTEGEIYVFKLCRWKNGFHRMRDSVYR